MLKLFEEDTGRNTGTPESVANGLENLVATNLAGSGIVEFEGNARRRIIQIPHHTAEALILRSIMDADSERVRRMQKDHHLTPRASLTAARFIRRTRDAATSSPFITAISR